MINFIIGSNSLVGKNLIGLLNKRKVINLYILKKNVKNNQK